MWNLYFSLFLILGSNSVIEMVVTQQNTAVGVNVGVVLDMDNWVGKIGLSCIDMALSDFYATHSHYLTRLQLHTRNTNSDVIAAAAAAVDLIKNGEVQVIVGPSTSMEAEFVIKLGEKAQVPIISFSASSPFLTSGATPYFFRATQNDSTQVNAIAAIVENFRWKEAVAIYINNEYGQGIISYLLGALQATDVRVPYQSPISPVATDDQIVKELYKLMKMQARVFIVHMSPTLGSRFFTKVREVGMMNEGYVWILTDGMTNFLSSLAPSVIDSMQGVLGVRTYAPNTKQREDFRVRWKRKYLEDNPSEVDAELNIYGLWAYDVATALAMAIEKAGTQNLGFKRINLSSNLTDLEIFGISQNGPKLGRALSDTSFKGLAGYFQFVDGQLQLSTFEIVNVNGDGAKGIGFWTPKEGLAKKLNSTKTSSSVLGSIIWPGDSISIPKGWEVPRNGTKLSIGVPVKDGYGKFVMVTKDPISNNTAVSGYCIDIFDAVGKALGLNYEYKFFGEPGGENAGSYDDLVYQVHQGKYDGVVGDVTIIFNRSQYVDFSLPFTESGVYMVVPNKDDKNNKALVFLKPLTPELWCITFGFFLLIGFVVWVLEHKIDEESQGQGTSGISNCLYFSFSTMYFAHRETLQSNLARVVVIVWCYVVLILVQNYTANLTSLYTTEQLLATVTDVHQLIKNGDKVGYKNGSFVQGILITMGFDESKLVAYESLEEVDRLFSKGSLDGGIAAVFDEVPYMDLFLAQYCSKYTKVEPIYKTDGFGFVFPLGSPLVAYVSRAILNVTEGPIMAKIEETWLGVRDNNNCQDLSASISTHHQLRFRSFWVLFLIAAAVSIVCLIIYAIMFVKKHWPSNSGITVREKIVHVFRIFYHRRSRLHNLTTAPNATNLGDTNRENSSRFSIPNDLPEQPRAASSSSAGEHNDADSNEQPSQDSNEQEPVHHP